MENNPLEKKDSAEQQFLVEKYDEEMRLAEFVTDPQEYVNKLRDYLFEVHPEEHDHAILAIEELMELQDLLQETEVAQLHPEVATFMNHVGYDIDGLQVMFRWLREAGFSYAQVMTWVKYEGGDMASREQLASGTIRIAFNEVFGE